MRRPVAHPHNLLGDILPAHCIISTCTTCQSLSPLINPRSSSSSTRAATFAATFHLSPTPTPCSRHAYQKKQRHTRRQTLIDIISRLLVPPKPDNRKFRLDHPRLNLAHADIGIDQFAQQGAVEGGYGRFGSAVYATCCCQPTQRRAERDWHSYQYAGTRDQWSVRENADRGREIRTPSIGLAACDGTEVDDSLILLVG